MKYRVDFSGVAYVEASDVQAAKDMFYRDNVEYEEYEITDVELIDDFVVEI